MSAGTQEFIAAARAAFLADGIETLGIRAETLASWRRCKAAGVPATGRVSRRTGQDFDRDSALLRAVRPVTEDLMSQFHASDFGMVLIDRDARVVGRWTANGAMESRLDGMSAVPGAVFDESFVGSTALGTPLEEGRPAIVDGAEHYNETFDSVVATGVPVTNPATDVVEGVLDLVAPTGAPSSLMLPLAAHAARDAGDRLASGHARHDRELLDAYLRLDRRGHRRPLAAVNSRLLVVNRHVGDTLAGHPQLLLWEQVERAISRGERTLRLDRGAQTPLSARIRVIGEPGQCLGAVLQLVPGFPASEPKGAPCGPRVLETAAAAALRGRSLRWTSAVQRVREALAGSRPVVLTGPSGSGKSFLAVSAAQQQVGNEGRVEVAEASAGETMPEHCEADALVLDGVDLREGPGELLRRVVDARRASGRLTVLVSWCSPARAEEAAAAIGGDMVELPSLAHRSADIADLVRAWADRQRSGVSVDATAVHELARRSWPGNVRQLFTTLDRALAARPHGRIDRAALGFAGTPAPHRELTFLENVEREAIAALIDSAGGSRMRVAQELGVSRSTLYRKLAALGLDI